MLYGGLCVKTLTASPPDPLDDLRSAEYAHLEALARRDLWRRMPSLRRLLDQGRCAQIVRQRMRVLLAQARPLAPPRRPAPPDPWDYPDLQP